MKRTRYNWKARQKSLPVEKKSEKTFHVELDESLLDGGCTNTSDYPLDSNLPVLPCKKAKVDEGSGEHAAKRKKLNAKQRKRLLKVVEAKQKKAKVGHSNYSAPHVVGAWLHTKISLRLLASKACLHGRSLLN